MKDWYLVSYDVRDAKRLRRTAKILKGFGSRVQYSIFRCHLSERDVEQLRWELSKVLTEEDGILYVGLCDACMCRIRVRDARGDWPEEPPAWAIL